MRVGSLLYVDGLRTVSSLEAIKSPAVCDSFSDRVSISCIFRRLPPNGADTLGSEMRLRARSCVCESCVRLSGEKGVRPYLVRELPRCFR